VVSPPANFFMTLRVMKQPTNAEKSTFAEVSFRMKEAATFPQSPL